MPYPIEFIEGIGETYGRKLRDQGINTVGGLLDYAATKAGRGKLHALTHIPESLILTWVNHADLMRINGIAAQTSELLEAAGVDTVKELATRKAENLHEKLKEVNDKLGLSGKVPSVGELSEMIAQASALPEKVTH